MQGKDISLNRGSSLSADSPERSFLDAISSFKFVECHGFATAIAIYKDSTPSQHLVASDIYERTQYLADTVLSYIFSLSGREWCTEKVDRKSSVLISG